jgi:hypothetical protein
MKEGRTCARPFFDANVCAGDGLERNPEAQPHAPAIVHTLLGVAVEQPAELVIWRHVLGRVNGQELSSGLIHTNVEVAEKRKRATTNQITGSPFANDLSGNMTNDATNTQIVYDAGNHVVSSSGSLGSGTYTYDGNGYRVQ